VVSKNGELMAGTLHEYRLVSPFLQDLRAASPTSGDQLDVRPEVQGRR
jgi:hypothetical protein